jgi:hypothetical protein
LIDRNFSGRLSRFSGKSNGLICWLACRLKGMSRLALGLIIAATGWSLTATPKISGLSLTTGAVGAGITIWGSDFGASQGTSTVTFNGTSALPTSWSSTTIAVNVPSGATTGYVVVTVGGVASNGVTFTVVPAPAITNLTPASGAVGAALTITGTNFGSYRWDNVKATLNGILLSSIWSWSTTSIATNVPSGATTGSVVVTVNGVASNGVSFTVLPTPSITSLTPSSGAVGTPVTIAGANFGSSQGTSTVSFNGAAATATNWSATSITVNVPSGATTGSVVVTVNGVASNGAGFTVLPTPSITSLTPASGTDATVVTIAGSNFGTVVGTVTFNGLATVVWEWDDRSIVAPVPTGVTTGDVVVTAGGVASNRVTFTVLPPAITSITPTAGAPGASVTIEGSHFGSGKGNQSVTFNGQAASFANWSDSSVVATVPAGATTGDVVVHVSGVASNGMNFTVLPAPSITSVSPVSGTAGSLVTIVGSHFGATQGSGTVTFNGAAASPSSWSDTSITTAVPVLATTGNVVVTANGAPSNGINFTVISNLSITSLSPASGVVGATVTITGSGFGANQGSSTVTFNGVSAAPNYWSATMILVEVPESANSGNVVVTVGGQSSNGVTFTVLPIPLITSVTPASGAAGVQVTISGSRFGNARGSGTVWLGSTYGTVVSWSDTSIVATVASNAVSGDARVQQNGVWSSAVPFHITTASLAGVTPSSGVAGTPVTISGSGFGAAQGSGQVWLGTANGVVQTWSDTQIVAQVAAGSASGNARVLQNGVLSNALPFTVNTLHIASIGPEAGMAGTSVTISGGGFGVAQGTGTVLLGSAAGQVTSWSDTRIVATVAPSSLSGVASVQQNGVWSNAVPFVVPVAGGNTVTPAVLNLVVGETHTIQAVGTNGQPVTGLAWTSSDPTVVSLSTDDPPVLTAVAAGHATITAGSGTANVTVSTDALPAGTTVWSNPGNGSGVGRIVPAVPSATGVADVFAFQNDGTVQALASDGTTAWTADVSAADPDRIVPDFQGGLVVVGKDGAWVKKLDGLTGQVSSTYTADNHSKLGPVVVHADGTIFAVQIGTESNPQQESLIGIDPATGSRKFIVTPAWTEDTFGLAMLDLIIAGDGMAYVPYQYDEGPLDVGESYHLRLLRVNSTGSYDDIGISDWISGPRLDPGEIPGMSDVGIITNGDTGALLSWQANWTNEMHMAVIAGSSVSLVAGPGIGSQISEVKPALQAQDGSFVGVAEAGDPDDPTPYMVAFDASGSVRWSVPNVKPMIATADGGVIAQDLDGDGNALASATIYDQNGNAVGQMASLPTQSWTGNLYQDGPVYQLLGIPALLATSLWAMDSANNSENEAAAGRAPTTLVVAKVLNAPQDCYSSVGIPETGSYAERDITYWVVDQYKRRMGQGMKIQERLKPAPGTPCPGATTLQDGFCVGQWIQKDDQFPDSLSANPQTGHSEFTQMFWVATPENTPGFAAFYGQIPFIDAYQASPSQATSLTETQNVISVNGNTGMKADGTPIRRCNVSN